MTNSENMIKRFLLFAAFCCLSANIFAQVNIKVTEKLSVKSDEQRNKIDELEIDEFAQDRIDKYILEFLKDTVSFNT